MSWTEATTADGKVYYFNADTGQSTWSKPEGYVPQSSSTMVKMVSSNMPPANVGAVAKISGSTSSTANIAASWRELTTQDGRKYYSNAITNVSVWEMPPEYKDYLDRQRMVGGDKVLDRQAAEKVFFEALRSVGVKSESSWEEALRLVIDHPDYKVLPSLQERKEAFSRYKDVQRQFERDERMRLAMEARDAFRQLLENDDRIQPNTRWAEAQDLLKDAVEYKAIASPRDRLELFEEYITKLRRSGRTARKRSPALVRFGELLRSLSDITVETTWKEAIQVFSASAQYKEDRDLQNLAPLDLLVEYEEYVKELEANVRRQKRDAELAQRRAERLARKELRAVIKGLVDTGRFTALTGWKEFCGLTRQYPCFEAMITPFPNDPTPLDYYWDALDQLQSAYLRDRPLLMEIAAETDTPKDLHAFTERVRRSDRFNELKDLQHIELAFKELDMRGSQPGEVDRKLVERYKQLIKHWPGPKITVDSKYEEFRALLAEHDEFRQLNDEEVRRSYFDKYIVHLRKKAGIPVEPPRSKEEEPEEGEVIEEEDSSYRRRYRY